MIAPTRRLCLLAALPLVPTAALFLAPAAWPVVAAIDLLVLAVAVGDLATLPGRDAIRVRRELEPIATRGVRHPVTIVVENRTSRPCDVELVDDRPPTVAVERPPEPVRLAGGGRARATYWLVPEERGEAAFERVYVRLRSGLGLWRAVRGLPAAEVLRVYPALKHISRYALYARTNRMSLLGVRHSRRIGTSGTSATRHSSRVGAITAAAPPRPPAASSGRRRSSRPPLRPPA